MKEKRSKNGEGCLYKVGEVYYVEFKIKGKRIKRSLKTGLRTEAEKRRQELARTFQMRDKLDLVREVAAAKSIIQDHSPILLNNAWDYHLNSGINQISEQTAEIRAYAWQGFVDFLIKRYLVTYIHDIQEDHLVVFFNQRAKEIAKSTYDSQKMAIRQVLKSCRLAEELLEASIWGRKVKEDEDKPKRTGFSLEEAKTIMEEMPDIEMRHLFILGLYTGTRPGDACLMTWDKIDFEKRLLTYTPSKTKHSSGVKMEIPLLTPVFDMLSERKKQTEGDYVFPEMKRLYQDLAKGRFQFEARKALEKLGIKTQQRYKSRNYCVKSFHSCRYTLASMYANLGIPRVICQEILGHSSEEINRHYTHTDSEYIRKAMLKYEEAFDNK